jgi:hypothetical protein
LLGSLQRRTREGKKEGGGARTGTRVGVGRSFIEVGKKPAAVPSRTWLRGGCTKKKATGEGFGSKLGWAKKAWLSAGSAWASFLLLLLFFRVLLLFFFLQNYFRKKQERALERVQNMFQQIKFENFIFI